MLKPIQRKIQHTIILLAVKNAEVNFQIVSNLEAKLVIIHRKKINCVPLNTVHLFFYV